MEIFSVIITQHSALLYANALTLLLEPEFRLVRCEDGVEARVPASSLKSFGQEEPPQSARKQLPDSLGLVNIRTLNALWVVFF
jgi:hypothetical protein